MRDLKADLNCVTVPVGIMKIKELYAIAEHALNRAITAEAENAKLHKVADAARAYLKGGYNETLDELVLTVLELDKEGER